MRIAVVTSATAGGAGIAAMRTAQALQTHGGHQVDVFDVAAVGAVDPYVSPQRSVSNGRLSNTHFTADHGTASREWLVRTLAGYDVVNVHWSSYLLSVADLEALAASGTPMLLTMHDFNHVTGGCHYPAGCTGLHAGCEACPQVTQDLFPRAEVQRMKLRRNALLSRPNVHLAAPSRYVLDAAGDAARVPAARRHLLRNPYAPLGDASFARPVDGAAPAMSILLVADSLTERRKGARLAAEALFRHAQAASARGREVHIHVAGTADEALLHALRSTGAKLHVHGRVTAHARLVEVYRACEVQICSSHEDNWPNVLVEAGAYGCLAVAGPGHGSEEFCRRYDAGPVATAYTPEAFADALEQLAEMPSHALTARRAALAEAVRREHDPATVVAEVGRALERIVEAHATGTPPAVCMPPAVETAYGISSNYIGAHTRELLARQGSTDDHREVTLARVRPATSAGLLNLHAVYGRAQREVVRRGLDTQALSIPARMNDAPLMHVFASEANEYGLSTLRCAFVEDTGPAECAA